MNLQGNEVEWQDDRPTPDKGGQGLGGGIGRVAQVTSKDATIEAFDNYAREPVCVIVPLDHLSMKPYP